MGLFYNDNSACQKNITNVYNSANIWKDALTQSYPNSTDKILRVSEEPHPYSYICSYKDASPCDCRKIQVNFGLQGKKVKLVIDNYNVYITGGLLNRINLFKNCNTDYSKFTSKYIEHQSGMRTKYNITIPETLTVTYSKCCMTVNMKVTLAFCSGYILATLSYNDTEIATKTVYFCDLLYCLYC